MKDSKQKDSKQKDVKQKSSKQKSSKQRSSKQKDPKQKGNTGKKIKEIYEQLKIEEASKQQNDAYNGKGGKSGKGKGKVSSQPRSVGKRYWRM